MQDLCIGITAICLFPRKEAKPLSCHQHISKMISSKCMYARDESSVVLVQSRADTMVNTLAVSIMFNVNLLLESPDKNLKNN